MARTWKMPLWSLAAIPAGALAIGAQTQAPQGFYAKPGQTLALTHATLVTAPGERRDDATLVIRDGRILDITDQAPPGSREIDLKGAWIYPGFIDPYSNYGLAEPAYPETDDGPHYRWQRPGGQAYNAAIHASRHWRDSVKHDPEQAKAWLDDGFTALSSARLDGIFQGYAVTLSLADKDSNQLIYKDQGRQFLSFDKGSSPQEYPSSLMGAMALVRQTLSDAAWYREAEGRSLAATELEYNADLKALGPLKQHGLVVAPTDENNLLSAARLFAGFELKPVYLGSQFEYQRAEAVAKAADTLILPLNFPKPPALASAELRRQVTLADLRHWERAPSNPAILAEQGLKLAFTRHDSEGSIWPNLKKAVKRGLSEQQALAALTTVPAAIAGIQDQAGRLAPGMMADLVIANDNLFDDGKILSVWTQGQPHARIPLRLARMWGDFDVAGGYRLSIGGDAKPEVTLKKGDDALKVQSAYVDGRLNLSFVADDKPQHWVLSWHNDELRLSSGPQPLSLTPVQPQQEEEPQASEALVGQLSYPNLAYGVPALPEREKLHIANVTLWTSEDDGIVKNADVLVSRGKIEEVGQGLETPRGYQKIDGTGLHLSAGIIDEHSHLAISGGVNEFSDAVTSEVRIGDVLNPNDIGIYRALAGGTTTAHLLHGSANPIGGQAQLIKLRWGKDGNGLKFKQAPPSIKFALGENVKQANWGDDFDRRYPQTRMGVPALVADAFQSAREYRESRLAYDLLSRRKQGRQLPPRRDYRLDALVEIMDKERLVHAHSYVASEILALMEVAERFDFSISTFTHVLEGYKVADELREHGAGASTFADWWAYKFEVYDAIVQNACLMHDKGVLTSINSDSPDLVRRLNLEAAKSMAYCNMAPADAWKMVTLNPAKQLGVDQYVGSIKEGKHADLVLWDANPLTARAKVQATWVDGRRYFDRGRDLQQRERVMDEKQALINKVLASGEQPDQDQEGYRPPLVHWHCDDLHREAL
ncbi:amidohydrolase family protein [Gallaecimonas sp. GXIMD4217]|uniref:amidohydrolase family protein n=1 Tax=Gallaecimonas sp. GXIMD4217 TaxID=3131927 RepID=UPI00311B28DD